MANRKLAKKKPAAPPRKRVAKKPKAQEAKKPEAQEAALKYRKENEDIMFAVEAMRTARLGHQVQIEHFGRRIYRVFS